MDFTKNDMGTPSKEQRALWPPNSREASWTRLQPLITAPELKALFLFGIPLVSAEPDPVTKERQVMTDSILERHIEKAVELAETASGLTIMPTEIEEKLAFDRPAFSNYGFFQIDRRPAWVVRQLTIQDANGANYYTIPNQWVDAGRLYRGLFYIIPLTLAFAGSAISPGPATGAAGAAFLAALGGLWWTPSYWAVQYVAGFPDAMLPGTVNELIGTIASINILSQLGATHARVTSASIGVDGLSQSTGLSGPNIYQVRITQLQEEKKALVAKLKTVFGLRWALGNV